MFKVQPCSGKGRFGFSPDWMCMMKEKIWMPPDSKVHGANMGPTWVLSGPDGPHVGPMNLAIRGT